MPIDLESPRTAGTPVLKRRQIGEEFVGGVIRFDQRNLLKDGQPVLKDNGKPRQELVVHLLTLGGTMAAGLGDNLAVPPRGEIVRTILKGGAFGEWIDAKNTFATEHHRGLQVGDLLYLNTSHAVRYQSTGNHAAIGEIHTAEELEQYYATNQAYRDRREALGFRGALRLRPARPDEAAFVVDCETAYAQLEKTGIPLEEPFPTNIPPAAPAAPAAPRAVPANSSVADLF